ncbi:MAG: peptide ABC transporter substrate-binding protein [Bacillota bacterium]|nr:peptide ABC transporter substrate-binding protein [Bacillota bacterium]
MKKLFVVALTLLLGLGLFACNPTTTAASVTELNWNIGAEPLTIDPTLNGASDGGDVINQTFEGLIREVNGVISPGIAESWTTSADGLTVTFTLRDSKWSDGSDFTAADFIYSWRRGLDLRTASEYSWIWEYTNIVGALESIYWTDECDNGTEICTVYNDDGDVIGIDHSDGLDDTTGHKQDAALDAVGISAPDDNTLVVELLQRTEYIVSLLGFYHFLPVKQSAVEADPDGGAWAIDPALVVCNGPFVLTEYTPGSGLVLEKNENYWNAEEISLTKINGEFIDDDASAYIAYQQGQLDVIPTVPAPLITALRAVDEEFYVFALLGTYYANFNMDDPLLGGNAKLRLALTYSIDREAICEALSAGQIPATGFVPEGFVDHTGADFSLTAGTYGIAADDSMYDEAVTLFAEAATELGMTVAQLRTAVSENVYMYNTSSSHQLVGEMMQASWSTNLGVNVTLENQDWATFQNSRKDGDYDIARGGWLTDFMDPAGMLAIFMEGNAYNDPNYDSVAYNTLMAEASAATTAAVHFAKLYDALDVLMADMPIIPIYYYSDILMVQSYVKGWGRSVLGTIDLTKVYIEGK